jgi:hypothetical protein
MGAFKFDVSAVPARFLDWLPFRWTWISGVEVTQAIQYYRSQLHLTDPADRRADNSARVVANKPAWVRVYAQSLVEKSVTASLTVERRLFGFLWLPVSTLSPTGSGVVSAGITESYDQERSSTTETVNFVIPAAQFHGTLRLKVRLRSATSGTEYDTHTLVVNANLRQTLRLRAILVSYNGPSTSATTTPPPPNVSLAAPTLADAQATAARALLMMPVQSTGWFTSAGTVAWNLPIDDPRSGAGACSPNWNALLNRLTQTRTNDGNRGDVVYYGLLPAGIPIGVPGCGVGGLGAGRNGDQGTFVHEIGHGYGFQHTPCGNTGASDPNYPTYEPYPSASIGEYGLNISNGTVFSPANTYDYMCYCGPQWMSLYQHGRLINHPRLDPEFVGDLPLWVDKLEFREYVVERDLPYPPDPWKQVEMTLRPVIAMSGVVRSKREVEVVSVARVDAMGSPPGEATKLTAELIDGDGRVVAAGTVMRLRTHGDCGCADDHATPAYPYPFEAYVPTSERGALIRVFDGEESLWQREPGSKSPEVREVSARVEEEDGTLRVWWSGDVADESTSEAWLQWSDDEGRTWHGLATGIRDSEATVPTSGLPPGSLLVRLLLHDGFDTVVSEPVSVSVGELPPEVAILSPRDGEMVVRGGSVRLWGAAMQQDGSPLGDEDTAVWSLDGDQVQRGLDTWLDAPAPGEHTLELTVGESSRAAVTFRVVDPETDYGKKGSASV